jgi:hypothetical protein
LETKGRSEDHWVVKILLRWEKDYKEVKVGGDWVVDTTTPTNI